MTAVPGASARDDKQCEDRRPFNRYVRPIMRRILVEIPDDQLDALAAIAADEQRSQEAILRDAIAAYLARHMPARAAFGLWQGRGIEGWIDSNSCGEVASRRFDTIGLIRRQASMPRGEPCATTGRHAQPSAHASERHPIKVAPERPVLLRF